MASSVSTQDVADSILQFAQTGTYPDSNAIATSELPQDLEGLLAAVAQAEETVKDELDSHSAAAAPAIDDWLAQATALQSAIAQSRATARSIVDEAAAGRALAAHVHDAAAKVALLQTELRLNETLEGALDTIQVVVGLVDAAAGAVREEEQDVLAALAKLLQAEQVLAGLRRDGQGVGDCYAVSLLEKRLNAVRALVVDEVLELWRSMVVVDPATRSITVSQTVQSTALSLPDVVDAMTTLGLLNTAIARLHRDFEVNIISPRMKRAKARSTTRISSSKTEIRLTTTGGPSSAVNTIDDVHQIIDYISQAFPFALSQQLLANTLPTILLQLVADWLGPSLPLNVKEAASFKQVVASVEELAAVVTKIDVELPSEADLSEWLRRIPQSWVARKREASLAELRIQCYRVVKQKKTVERVETQTVEAGDVMFEEPAPSKQDEDKWDEDWGNDETSKQDDDDTSAWDDPDTEPSGADDGEDDANAWGWGDEVDSKTEDANPTISASTRSPGRAGIAKVKVSTKEVTLRETYTITAIPDTIISLIEHILSDAVALSTDEFPLPTIRPAAKALGTIPTLVLAMYRATASTLYNTDPAGQMLIYNDAVHLSGLLEDLVTDLPPSHPLADRLRTLEADITALVHFSRRAYGREMDAQRTILADILSSTAGFVNSTAPLNTQQYRATVQDAVKRVRDLDALWRAVLSDSARLQSLGSLTGTLARQMVADVLERADDPVGISEEQSTILKSFCDGIAELADLFQPPGEEGAVTEEVGSAVHIYTPGWFRFKYLSEILVASLADIKYLWTEGELKLEFRADEVIDLIQALFADSSYRRDAIRDIKRSVS